ncbi:MAG TPA: MBL fold metallo-hydrolase [Dehalococcoidia bacterium]|nr:MBL fold metallo-hydrolase [Dehalococcoidia bacterium]
MEIIWLGHACFRLRAREATVVTDPYDNKVTGYTLNRPSADLVTVSIDDPAHNNAGGVGGDPRVIDAPGEYEIAGASVIGVPLPGKDGRTVAYVIDLEDMRIAHLGATAAVPRTEEIEEFSDVDVLLVPVGGGLALDAAAAAETVSLIGPKLVMPMHYKTPAEKQKLDPVDRFLKEMGGKPGETFQKLSVTRSSLPEETQVVVLEYRR